MHIYIYIIKIDCTEKLLGFQSWLGGKTTYIPKLHRFKNRLNGKNSCTTKNLY
jgi:hypothetical protein